MGTHITLLKTNRLALRAIQPSDLGELFRMNSDPVVMKYVGNGSTRSQEQMLDELDMLMSYYSKRPGMGVWAIELKTSSKFVGAGGLTFNTNKTAVELGYRLLKEEWGKGYATEAASALLAYAFQTLKANKVIASAHVDNIASRRVLEKTGMKHVGNDFEFDCIQACYEISATGECLGSGLR